MKHFGPGTRTGGAPADGPGASPIPLRARIAREAALILLHSGRNDFRAAKRKAAVRLGATHSGSLPSNREIEAAIREAQRASDGGGYSEGLATMRGAARTLCNLLAPFHPKLTGDLVAGICRETSTLSIHVFAEPAEEVLEFLERNRVRYRSTERTVRYRSGKNERVPTCELTWEGMPVELLVFSFAGQRQAPVSRIDGRPMKRLGPHALVSDARSGAGPGPEPHPAEGSGVSLPCVPNDRRQG